MRADLSPPALSAPSRRWLLPACLVSAAAAVFFFLLYPDVPPSPDEQEYLALADQLVESGQLRLPSGEVAKRVPLYPAMLASLRATQSPELWQNAALMLQTILAGLTPIIIGLIAERLADSRAAFFAATVAALYAPYRFLQMSFLSETLLIFLTTLALLVYIRLCTCSDAAAWASRRRLAGLCAVSVLLGAAALTRPDAILLLLPFAIDAVLRAGASVGRRILVAALVCGPALACTAGWAWRNHQSLGALAISSTSGLNFYLGHNARYAEQPGLGDGADYQAFDHLRQAGFSERDADRELFRRGWQFVLSNPGRTVVDTGRKVVVWLTPTIASTSPTLPLLILVYAVWLGRHGRRRGASPRSRLVWTVAVCLLPLLLVYWLIEIGRTHRPWVSPRFLVPLGLIAMILPHHRFAFRPLLAGLFAVQLMVAILFIPLSRLRWTVDHVLLLALAVGLSGLCRWLGGHRADQS